MKNKIDYGAIKLLIKRDNLVGQLYNKIKHNNPNLSNIECFDVLYDRYITNDTYIAYDYKLCKEEVAEIRINRERLLNYVEIISYYVAGRGCIEQNSLLSKILNSFINRSPLIDDSYLSLGVLLNLGGERKPIELLIDDGKEIFTNASYKDLDIKVQAIVEPIVYEINGVLAAIKAKKHTVA